MKAINLKVKYGVRAFYEAAISSKHSGHKVETAKAAANYAEWLLNDPMA